MQKKAQKTPHSTEPRRKWDASLKEPVAAALVKFNHGENAGTLGMVPLIINPIYTLYSGYLLGISPFNGTHFEEKLDDLMCGHF